MANWTPTPAVSRLSVPGTRLPDTRNTWFCAAAPLACSSLTVRKYTVAPWMPTSTRYATASAMTPPAMMNFRFTPPPRSVGRAGPPATSESESATDATIEHPFENRGQKNGQRSEHQYDASVDGTDWQPD